VLNNINMIVSSYWEVSTLFCYKEAKLN